MIFLQRTKNVPSNTKNGLKRYGYMKDKKYERVIRGMIIQDYLSSFDTRLPPPEERQREDCYD